MACQTTFPATKKHCCRAIRVSVMTGLEARLAAEINNQRFIPFLALHEFEAWVFCNAEVLAKHFDRADLAEKVADAIAVAGEPELINHGKDTHPKARLQAMATKGTKKHRTARPFDGQDWGTSLPYAMPVPTLQLGSTRYRGGVWMEVTIDLRLPRQVLRT
jgi:hypothetical protein